MKQFIIHWKNLFQGQRYQYLFQKTESGISRLSAYEGLNLGNPNLAGNFITDSMLNGDISYHNVCKLLGIAPGMDTISYIGGIEVTEEDRLVDGVYSEGNAEELTSSLMRKK